MSRSPLEKVAAEDDAYAAAWAALNKLLRRGYSFSGREPDCAYLNLRGQGFANVSSAAGFDSAGDARALALVDWDQDGDQDAFLTSRTAPRVQFLQNDQATGNASVTLVLAGTRANTDAIGARVELTLVEPGGARRTLLRGVRAGEGYLAQSSTRLTLGLGPRGARIETVRVAWPGGAREEFRGVEPGGIWRLEEGAGAAARADLPRSAPLAHTGYELPPATSVARIPLVRPVPLPRIELVAEDGGTLPLFGIRSGGEGTGTGKSVLLELFSTTCAPCAVELEELARRAAQLEAAGLAVLALSVEPVEERARAGLFLRERGWPFPWATATPQALEILDALTAILLDRERRLPLPASFLVDAQGALRVLYLGPVMTAAQVLEDRALCDLGEGALFEAASPFSGRWMFPGLPSDADFLEGRLEGRGLSAAAREYGRSRYLVVRNTPPADLLHDFGRRKAVEGKFDEAKRFYRRALTVDPGHFDTLSDLAVVLHREEDLSAAAELYGKALALRPEHEDTRFNLALAQVGMGDRASAERQLRWLKERGAEAAPVLEQALAGTAPK